MSKRMAIMPCMEFDQSEYFPYAVESLLNEVDLFLFSVNTRSWGNSDITLTEENKQFIQEFVKTNPKFRLLMGTWENEPDQHNAGLKYAIDNGCNIVFCTSDDQVYTPGEPAKMMNILENSEADILKTQWYTFWKKEPLYVIWPPEGFCPTLAIKPKQFKYNDVSEGVAIDENGNERQVRAIVLGINDVKVFHFSFARDDEFIKHKMEMSSHRHQVIPGWYENVWKNYKPEMENLNPCFPGAYKKAVPFPLDQLPPKIRGYFKMLGEKKRWYNMF